MSGSIYLDWNATTPPHPDVLAAMREAEHDAWANPASVHAAGRRARARLDELREAISRLFSAHSRDVVLTSGGTEANNLALGAVTAIVTSRIEHPSVTRVAELVAGRGAPVEWMRIEADGRIAPNSVSEALARVPRGATVAVMAASHETGVIQSIAEIAERCHALGARLHVDAVQVLGKMPLDALHAADSVSIAAHKIRGPKGIGALVWRGSPAALRPVLVGGSQERGLRPGTQDAVLAAGFAAALRRVAGGPERYAALCALRDRLEQELSEWASPVGSDSPRLPHVTCLEFRDWLGDELVAALDLAGVEISSGAACSAGTAEASPSLSEMLGARRARRTVRASLGDATTAEEIDRAILLWRRVVSRELRSA